METPTAVAIDPKVAEYKSLIQRTRSLFITENVTLEEHYKILKEHPKEYICVLLLLIHQGLEISKASRTRCLAALWACKYKKLGRHLLELEELFTLVQVLGAATLLDSSRQVRALEKKISMLEKSKAKVRPKSIGILKSKINDLTREPLVGSLSGALVAEIRDWAKKVTKEDLEYYALAMPKEPWKELADVTHIKPEDLQAPWFLRYCFGEKPPVDSLIVVSENLSDGNLMELLKAGNKIPYSYIRTKIKPIPEKVKGLIASYTPLSQVIWYYEELSCPAVDSLLTKRLVNEDPDLPYGKLMERILTSRETKAPFSDLLLPYAEKRLSNIKLRMESPVVVIGDASSSMDVAIRVATVIASVVCAVVPNAQLKFFSDEPMNAPFIPTNSKQVIELTETIRAEGATSPASALWEFYAQRKIVKCFIMVTDEEENVTFKGFRFAKMFARYCKEVYPAKILFVSFLKSNVAKGPMVTELEMQGLKDQILQFRLDGKRPDLTKMESILGLLASESVFFASQVKKLTERFTEPKPAETPAPKSETDNNNNNNNNTDKKPRISKTSDLAGIESVIDQAQHAATIEIPKEDLEYVDPNIPPPLPPINEEEFDKKSSSAPSCVDLVFTIDTTGSMSPYINAVKQKITEIMKTIKSRADSRFAIVAYRDLPPQDNTYITKVYPFTSEIDEAQKNVNTLSASGGGDAPECAAEGLQETSLLPWRENALKIAVFVTDAPPHGLPTIMGDGKPPKWDQYDPIQIARRFHTEQVVLYSVGCEPLLSSSKGAREFYEGLAIMTGGRYISLENSVILPDIIVGGVAEELELEMMATEIEKELKKIQKECANSNSNLSREQLIKKIAENLQTRGVTIQTLIVDSSAAKGEGPTALGRLIAQTANFKECCATMTSYYADNKTSNDNNNNSGKGVKAQAAQSVTMAIDAEQVARVMKKKNW